MIADNGARVPTQGCVTILCMETPGSPETPGVETAKRRSFRERADAARGFYGQHRQYFVLAMIVTGTIYTKTIIKREVKDTVEIVKLEGIASRRAGQFWAIVGIVASAILGVMLAIIFRSGG